MTEIKLEAKELPEEIESIAHMMTYGTISYHRQVGGLSNFCDLVRGRLMGIAASLRASQEAAAPRGSVRIPDLNTEVSEDTKRQLAAVDGALRAGAMLAKGIAVASPAATPSEEPVAQLDIGEFKPCIAVNEELGITEAIFEDVPYIAEPVFSSVYHYIDKHIAVEDGRLVGMTVWSASPVASPAVAPVAGSVKGLEWQGSTQGAWARSVFGIYYVSALTQLMPTRIIFRWKLTVEGVYSNEVFETEEAAKAAAQTDFNARILSSIIPDTKGGEPTDRQIKDATTEYLSHRGERPYRVLRGGQELWETHVPAMRSAFRAALSQDTDGVAKP